MAGSRYGSKPVSGLTHADTYPSRPVGWSFSMCPRGVAPAITDLLGGQVQVVFVNVAPSIGYIESGKLRALGLTTANGIRGITGFIVAVGRSLTALRNDDRRDDAIVHLFCPTGQTIFGK